MNEGELRTRAAESSEAPVEIGRSAAARPPLKSVTLLLPVWGYRFVSQFLEFCLPTLLAPGNIPAIAASLPCRFILLTSETDAVLIRSHSAWRWLEQTCDAEICTIDDLITDGNHTATITIAFARAVRDAGEAMLDTCFIFLMSDYLVADGSLETVVARIRQGASGVVAGNYQIVAEDALPLLRRRVDAASPSIILPPRELVRWSLAHLHPSTVANIVNFGLSHNAHTNRLFWRVDETTLIGRFYLMHMIGIRPEVTDFVVGASCDYSFIPEMCPSGNVTALTDSDEYLVVEMQPRDHDIRNLLPGPIEVPHLANSLLDWTTAEHRRNVEHTLIYHAGDIPDAVPQFVAESGAFVDNVRGLLKREPHPHRHHHYWIGSIAVNRARSRRTLSAHDWQFLLGEAVPVGGLTGAYWRLRIKLFGSLPDITRLHPRWPDYGLPLKAAKKVLSGNGRLLLVAPVPGLYAQWLARATHDIETIESDRLLELSRPVYQTLIGNFDAALMVMTESMLSKIDELIARTGPLLKPGGQIMIMVTNNRSLEYAGEFSQSFARQSARLVNLSAWLAEVHYVPANRMRWAIYRAMSYLAVLAAVPGWRGAFWIPFALLAAGPLGLASFLCNLGTSAKSKPPPGLWSSVFLILRPSADGANARGPAFPEDRNPVMGPSVRSDRAGEERIARRVKSHASSDLKVDVLRDDPSGIATTIAKYRFVAGLLSSRHDVAQYGSPDALAARLILSNVKKLAVYDPNPIHVYDLLRRIPEEWPFEANVHDILAGPLPKRHDSIFSLDMIQHISRRDEDIYIRNLRNSLSRPHDILIVGGPVLDWKTAAPARNADPAGFSESASTALAKSRQAADLAGADEGFSAIEERPNAIVRTAEELKALVERHFHQVFMFSMIDEIVHPGMVPLAPFVVAFCCVGKH